jgi:Rad52/22 family double-strand break repair protein
MLTDPQRETLLRPLKPARVNKTQGMSYLEAFDVIAHLTRIFGFEGWDKEIIRIDEILSEPVTWRPKDASIDKNGWNVAYRCAMRLTVRDPEGNVIKLVEDVSVGAATHQPDFADAHDLAVKSAVSGALKRCAKDLGDQFGLGLYDGGSIDACVKRVVIYPEISGAPTEEAVKPVGEVSAPAERSSAAPEPLPITVAQRAKIMATGQQLHLDMDGIRRLAADTLGVDEVHISSLTRTTASKVIDAMVKMIDATTVAP